MSDFEPCPCGSQLTYLACCGRHIDSNEAAPSAEALMRSRYSAYVRHNEAYIQQTWHPSTCPAVILEAQPPKWLGLKITYTEGGQPGDLRGRVAFVARYKIAGKAHRLVEDSEFVFENGRWLYL